jgi:hypothetical protein
MLQGKASVAANGVVHDLPSPRGRKVVGRPWPKGVSGNPSGRPDGALSRKCLHVRQLLDADAEAVIAKLIELALAGDVAAIKIVMDRISPVPRDRPIAVALPTISNAQDAMDALGAIVSAVGAGHVSPLEGETLSRLLRSYVELDALRTLEQRVAELERGKQQ